MKKMKLSLAMIILTKSCYRKKRDVIKIVLNLTKWRTFLPEPSGHRGRDRLRAAAKKSFSPFWILTAAGKTV